METLEVNNLVFEVRRSPRRTTLGLTVDRSGELVIHAPESSEIDVLARWTRSKLLWVHRKLLKKEKITAGARREPEFVNGESFGYLGKTFRLKVLREARETFRFDGKNFVLRASARSQASEHFRRWYVQSGRSWLRSRVNLLSRKVGVKAKRVAIRDLGYRWGSCAQSGVVYFNWKLLQLPSRVTDYVIAHELAHLLEPSHGPEFWRILDRSLPDWRIRSEELNLKARDIYWCHDAMRQ
jgi:predicted metal-dependent hydrolase